MHLTWSTDSAIDADHLTFHLTAPYSDGPIHLFLSPLESIERLAADMLAGLRERPSHGVKDMLTREDDGGYPRVKTQVSPSLLAALKL